MTGDPFLSFRKDHREVCWISRDDLDHLALLKHVITYWEIWQHASKYNVWQGVVQG